jgi:transposase
MRKGFTGLAGLVLNEMKRDPMQGEAYIFINKRRTMVKVLVWDRTGFVIYYKKLSSGTFEIPSWETNKTSKEIEIPTLLMMLEGVQIRSAKLRKRYRIRVEKRA